MFDHLLVPLDGSSLAEAVLPAMSAVARRCHSTVTLLHLVEPRPPARIHNQPHLQATDDAADYLARVAEQIRTSTEGTVQPRTETVAAEVDMANEIARTAQRLGSDLLVLSTHGRHGLRHFLFGSVAQQTVQAGDIPVLLVDPTEEGLAPVFDCHKILVPLDGSPVGEAALPTALKLAEVFRAALHLLVVVPTLGTLEAERAATGLLMPRTMSALLQFAEQGAVDYLRTLGARLQEQSIPVVGEVHRGDPAPEIVEVTERVKADIVVMATRGKTGLDAFWSNAVSPKVTRRASCPILLIRTEDE